MLAIHGIWADGALLLWAEYATRSVPVPATARVKPAEARSHPGAASPAALAAALAGLPGEAAELAWSGTEGELALWLPGTAACPQPSPELAAVPADGTWLAAARGGGRAALRAWRIPVLSFPAPAALPLLAGLGEGATPGRLAGAGAGDALLPIGPDGELTDSGPGGEPADEVIFGQSVPFLAACAALAADLAARGRLLPALTRSAEEASRYAARWRPVVSGADAQRVRELAQAMPPVCRATSEAGEPAAAVLAGLLDALTDAAARASLATDPGISLLPPRRGRRPAKVSVTERWAAALTSADPAFEVSGPVDEDEAAVLAADLAAWHAAAQVPPGPVRTCFRLIEPPLEEPGTASAAELSVVGGEVAGRRDWAVEFALQSADDPSLVLPASDIWAGVVTGWGAGASGSTGPGIGYPEEELLTGLGRASRLFPELDAELRTAAPAAVSLDTAGAWKFVREAGPLLSGAGFGVLLPDWARQRRLGLRISARSTPAAPGSTATTKPMFGLADMIDFRYELALGDVPLDPAELEELARLKVPLVRLRGQWVELTQDQLKAAVRFMERRGAQAGQMRAGDLLSAELHGTGDDLPVTSISADGWLGDLLASRDGQRLEPARTPDSFRGKLRPYQERGLAWLSFLGGLGLGGVLADDMGLGKTIQLLALLAREQDEHTERPGRDDIPGPGPSLLVCPMSVVGNWEREAAQFTPQLTVHTHHGAGRLTGEELGAAVAAADLVITSYGVATRDREALRQVTWRRVICDEAQNIKNAATRQAQAVRSLPAVSRIALTGTPVENRLADLWSIMEFTSQGLLGPAEKFRKAYSLPIERNGDEAATERLKLVTGPFILRRLKTDRSIIADLPDKLEMKAWCNLTPEQASLYQATVTDMLARIEAAEGIERRGLVLATMAKLKQVCNHPAHLLGDGSRLPGRSGKLARLEEICDEVVAGGEKALCFTQYAEFGRMLQPHLAARLGCPVFWLHGGTPKKQRDAMVDRFSRSTQPAVFLLSLKAGGTGLNLTAASHVIHVDRWWNPAVEDQATDRAFRIGQRRNVQVRKFVCVGTVEEKIDAMIEEKKALAERIVGTGESWLTELSVADLRKVVALGPEAVSA